MCIINAKPVKAKEVKAYRVYQKIDRVLVSCFGKWRKHDTGRWEWALTGWPFECQWHGWTSLKNAQKCRRELTRDRGSKITSFVIYDVRLRGNIKRGAWSNETSMSQYTADECKIIRRVKK